VSEDVSPAKLPRVYVFSDPHLGRPMDLFGPRWVDHQERVRHILDGHPVADDDLVLVCGDLSWARRPPEVAPDLALLAELPGTKVLIPGNHDGFWWQSASKVRAFLPPGMRIISNDAFRLGSVAVAGGKGYGNPDEYDGRDHFAKIEARHLHRLELSLKAAAASGAEHIVVMTHYPPSSAYCRLAASYGVRHLVFGHVHLSSRGDRRLAADFVREGVRCRCTSVDVIDFSPLLLDPTEAVDPSMPVRFVS